MLEKFKQHIENNFPFLFESKLLIAISGGLDSVVLTHLCKGLNLDVALAHCNFKLRSDESDGDERFVVALSEYLDLEVFIQEFQTEAFAKENKLSIQMAARQLRYDWFNDLVKDLNFDYVLTAHHADDNLETFLINLTRGSGLKGLIGVPECNENIVRPLLLFSRDDLEVYASEHQLKWREDSSNASDAYLRNKLRHQIIPNLKNITPELLSNFKKTITNLSDSADIIDERVALVTQNATASRDKYQIKFEISELKKVNNPKAYLFEIFNDYGFTEWNDIVGLLTAQSGKQVLSKTHRLLKDRAHLILTNRCHSEGDSTEESFFIINENDKIVEIPSSTLSFEEVSSKNINSKTTIYVDKDKLKFPLQLRKWQQGDVFYPFGMIGKKKLSKYYKDEKVSLIDKENTWLLCSDNQIVWILGMRADERFKVTDKTKQVLKIKLK